jgi:hypothetical protein
MRRRYREKKREQILALLSLNLGAKWSWVVKVTLRPLYYRERAPAPIAQNSGWPPGPAWTSVEKRKSLSPTGETDLLQAVLRNNFNGIHIVPIFLVNA